MDDLQRWNANESIRRVVALYAQLLDSGRLEEWIDLFQEEARFRVYGQIFAGRAVILDEIGGMQPPPDRPVKHVCLVPVIDLQGDDRALAWTDFSAFATNEEGRIEIATIGRYYDDLVRENDRWRFSSRTIVLAGEAPPPDLVPSPSS